MFSKSDLKKHIPRLLFNKYTLLIALLLVYSILFPSYFTRAYIRSAFLDNLYLFILAAGMEFIVLSGGLDLSVGGQFLTVAAVVCKLFYGGVPVAVCIAIGVGVGVLCGFFNGLLLTTFKLPVFWAMVATYNLFYGLGMALCSPYRVFTKFPSFFRWLSQETYWSLLGMPNSFWVGVVCVVIYGIIISRSYFGKYIIAMGENENALLQAGVNVNKLKIAIYSLASFFYSIGTIVFISRNGIVTSLTGDGLEMVVIPAVLLGNMLWKDPEEANKRWYIANPVVGTFTLIIIETMLSLLGWSNSLQRLIRGLVIILSIFISRKELTIKLRLRL